VQEESCHYNVIAAASRAKEAEAESDKTSNWTGNQPYSVFGFVVALVMM